MSDRQRNDPTVLADDERTSQWSLLGPAVFITLQLAVLVFITRPFPLEIALVIEAGLGGVLGLSSLVYQPRLPAIGGFLLTYSVSGAIVLWGLTTNLSLYLVALTLGLVLVVFIYGVHRYQRVRLGLVSTTEGPSRTPKIDQ